jgi:hypothetical protein
MRPQALRPPYVPVPVVRPVIGPSMQAFAPPPAPGVSLDEPLPPAPSPLDTLTPNEVQQVWNDVLQSEAEQEQHHEIVDAARRRAVDAYDAVNAWELEHPNPTTESDRVLQQLRARERAAQAQLQRLLDERTKIEEDRLQRETVAHHHVRRLLQQERQTHVSSTVPPPGAAAPTLATPGVAGPSTSGQRPSSAPASGAPQVSEGTQGTAGAPEGQVPPQVSLTSPPAVPLPAQATQEPQSPSPRARRSPRLSGAVMESPPERPPLPSELPRSPVVPKEDPSKKRKRLRGRGATKYKKVGKKGGQDTKGKKKAKQGGQEAKGGKAVPPARKKARVIESESEESEESFDETSSSETSVSEEDDDFY